MEVIEELIKDKDAKKFCNESHSWKNEHLVIAKPYGQIFREGYVANFHQKIQNVTCYEDDVWITSHPKSGTRWTQEIVWCLKNNMDLKKALSTNLNVRVPMLCDDFFANDYVDPQVSSFEFVKNMERPRIVHTHLMYDMLPRDLLEKKIKMIYVIRNPRDVIISYLNHLRILHGYEGDLQTLLDLFLKDLGPHWGPYFKHVLSYWNKKSELPNLLITRYEEMQADLPKVIKRIASFLEVTISDEDVLRLCDHVSFEKMKANPMVNKDESFEERKKAMNNGYAGKFINKGKSGTWKEYLTDEMVQRFEQWEEKWLKDTDLKFVYEV